MTRIVVGVDPSAAGARALQWALCEALSRGASVTAVRAWTPPAYGSYPDSSMAVLDEHVADEAQRLADEQLKAAREDVPGADGVVAHAVATVGPAARVLVDAAQDADLLVVGSRGAGVLSRAVLGSVASSVLHHAAGPVVVVPEAAQVVVPEAAQVVVPEAARPGEPGRVLVGVDHSPSSLRALRFAVEQAERTGRTLVPVLVHEPVVPAEGCFDVPPLEASERHALLVSATQAGASDVAVEPEVVTGHAGATLDELAHPQDLLVVGSRGRGGFVGLLLGSTSTSVAQHATCAVAVVREP